MLGSVVDWLRGSGASVWAAIIAVFGYGIIRHGPAWIREIATYRNNKMKIRGELDNEKRRIEQEIAAKDKNGL